MSTINGSYLGNLRCELDHPSGSQINTDAPKDNRGEGKFFSPTDLLASALGSCMLTIIGIRARDKQIEIGKPDFEIEKIMSSNPRKVSKIVVNIRFKEEIREADRSYLETEAKACPVALSINPSIEQEIIFEYA